MKAVATRLLAAAIVAFATTLLRADTPPAGSDPLIQKEFKQQQIRTTTQKLAEQLGDLTNEFDRNGIGGDDLQVLRSIRAVLGNLTDQQMEQVINLLQQARSVGDASSSRQRVLDAFTGQKNIIAQLRQLLLEYRRQLELYELSIRLTELANRHRRHAPPEFARASAPRVWLFDGTFGPATAGR